MLTVGLTGNAGSGKSTVAALWRAHGVEVIDADLLARELVDADRDLRRRLALEFGDNVLEPSAGAETGALRRDELARCAFASPART
ncbi:MAG: dephospho-CoA kinase, partial [Gemmatimonadetes bacterium]|nr:dephospho-CoA kinase [Gemmatimonadota bacterium]